MALLAAIVEWSLRNRVLVVAGWVGIAVAGAVSMANLPLDEPHSPNGEKHNAA